ncbi:putative non-specific serine/threonine protein kinase [Rosa chinensis]|uniref:Putative non-specific serine/threonine protein kinase n=1 Tax=Rosa chinensis TaxID=74649 RepID=A0A2P6PN29_ROSCH|nr:putative non-specific serine/threonine protein kinase [Rosa chinensis]
MLCYGVRQEAAVAYGALCAVVCSIPITSNGRQNHVMLGSLVDRFIGWALPLLSNISAGDGTAELALDGLREFLNVGDVGGIERYALSILKACQVLLEDERTSLSLLHRLLGVLTLISLKFSRYFQPHFLDIVDLLLGWALVPDLAESDRRIIMDSFLQFQNHWVGSLQFSLGLLSKFVGDMDVLIQDVSHGTPQQFRRLLALLSCFSTVLQSTASGLLEMNLLEQITEPLNRIIPRLLGCLSMVGRKLGGWNGLGIHGIDILFQSLEVDNSNQAVGTGRITSFQVHGVLKTNLQLLSLQKSGLLPISVQKILQFDAPISQLRLHVTGSSAATYIFLLQHENNEVVEQALTSLTEELELLKGMLEKALGHDDGVLECSKTYSKHELFALIKFDLKVLLSCVFLSGGNNYSLIGQPDIATLYLMRSEKLVGFIIEKFNPFDLPIMEYVDLQVNVLRMFDRLTVVKKSTCSLSYQSSGKSSMDGTSDKLFNSESLTNEHSVVVVENLRNYSLFFVKALHALLLLQLFKVNVLDWVQRFCENVIVFNEKSDTETCFYEVYGNDRIIGSVLYSILDAASDREPKVRSHVAIVLELLLQARLVHPLYFYCMAEVVLGKLGDPDNDIKNAFVRLLAIVVPTTLYACGLHDYGTSSSSRAGAVQVGNSSNLQCKQVFSLKQLPQQLHSQQLVSILSYISQRWKVPLSSWIQWLIHSCRSSKDLVPRQLEETGNVATGVWLDIKMDDGFLEKHCSVNNLAGAWWAVQEAARYCISTWLQTNLGGPTQTSAALERMLLDVAHLLQYDSEQTFWNSSMIVFWCSFATSGYFYIHQVLAITEDLHDVHSLGKEAAAVHRSLVEDLSNLSLIPYLMF